MLTRAIFNKLCILICTQSYYLYKILKTVLHIIGFVLIAASGFAQDALYKLNITNLNLESGISQCVVTDIKEDNKGFIWIGTQDGLNRFDGTTFKVFRYQPDDSLSIPSSKINKLFYDRGHHLWITTPNELAIFNTQTGKITGKALSNKHNFKAVCLANKKELWAVSSKFKLLKLNKNSLKITAESPINKELSPEATFIGAFSTNQSVFIISKNGICHEYKIKSKKWIKHNSDLLTENSSFNTTVFDYNHTIYLGSVFNDIMEFNTKTGAYIFSPLNSLENKILGINQMNFDSASNDLLMTTYGLGCFVYNIESKKVTQLNQESDIAPTTSNYPLSILKDQNNITWIGYDGKGIDVLDPNIKKFVPLLNVSDDEAYNLKFVRKIIEDEKGTLWFGTAGSGLIEYDRSTKKYTFHNKKELKPGAETFIIEMVKVENELWLALNSGEILIFDITNRRVKQKVNSTKTWNEMGQSGIWSFYYNKQKEEVWVGTSQQGFFRINSKTKEVKNYYDESKPIYQDNRMRSLYMTNKGTLLAGTTKGVLRYNRQGDRFEKIYPKKKLADKNATSIKSIFEDNLGQLWLGSDGSGITILDKQFNIKKRITTTDNLSNNVIYGILPQNDRSFWVSSNGGLSNIIWSQKNINDSMDITIHNYEKRSGLQSNEFNTNSYLKLKDGSLAFGGIDGVNIFKGEDIKNSTKTPTVAIIKFSVFDKDVSDKKMISYIDKIKLQYNQNSFSFNYTALGNVIQDKIQYKYRLKGLHEDWINADIRTYVSYTNLDPGSYEFQVKASNYDGFWGEEYTSLEIRIAPPIYKRWWFILLSIILLGSTIWSFLNFKRKQRNEKEALKVSYTKELAEVEMKALRAQINPHFLFNSLNSINNFILKNENKKARKYLVKFSQLVRNILNNSTNPYVSLKEELDTINLYVEIESMRFDSDFNFKIEIEDTIHQTQISIPSLLLQPYIENAIWHGLMHKEGEKNIDIRIKQSLRDYINIQIQDNGIGRRASQESNEYLDNQPKRKSYGMQLGESRLKLMNPNNQSRGEVDVIDLYDDQDNATGTLINIKLPLLNPNKTITRKSN